MQELDDVLARLQAVGKGLPPEEQPTFHPGASAAALGSLQECVPLPIPEVFLSFLRRCDAIVAMGVWNGYWVGGAETLEGAIRSGAFPGRMGREGGQADALPVAT